MAPHLSNGRMQRGPPPHTHTHIKHTHTHTHNHIERGTMAWGCSCVKLGPEGDLQKESLKSWQVFQGEFFCCCCAKHPTKKELSYETPQRRTGIMQPFCGQWSAKEPVELSQVQRLEVDRAEQADGVETLKGGLAGWPKWYP